MDSQTILAVAGIVVTIFLGVWAIVISIRYSRNVRITYAEDQAIALTDDITQNFPNLKIFYRDQPMSDNLVLLKGYFINTGKKDISREMVEEQITLKLPTDFEWIEIKVVECSASLKSTAILTSKTQIAIETGLWKTKEYLKFEALAKVPVIKLDPESIPMDSPTYRLTKSITFSHRIADSRKIQETCVPKTFPKTRILRFFGFSGFKHHRHASSSWQFF